MPDGRVEFVPAAQATRLHAAWSDLATRCLEPSVFSDPAFLLAAIAHLPRPADLVVVAVWDAADRLIGLCPVTFGAVLRPPRLASAWIHPQATASFPMLDRDCAEAALRMLLGAVGDGPGRPALFGLDGLPVDGATTRLLASLPDRPVAWLDRRSRAVLFAGEGRSNLSTKARKELRRQAARLQGQGVVAHVSATTPATVEATLSAFLALEARGWKGRRGTALGAHGGTAAFARQAIRNLTAAGLCRIDALTLDGQVLASGIVLRSGNRGYFWKTAYDEVYARFSPGVQLALFLTEAQRRDRDLAITDSCAISGHAMIDRLWPGRIEVADACVATRSGSSIRFVLGVTFERARRRLRAAAKQVYHRLGKHFGRLTRI